VSQTSERLRLFTAVDVPSAILDELDRTIDPHRGRVEGARWAPAANQHLTLKFLGAVQSERLPDVLGACADAGEAVGPSDVSVVGLGAFPTVRKARVLWAGIEDADGTLRKLATALDDALGPLGFESEKRRYTPHLTLARLRTPGDMRAIIGQVEFRSEAFRVERFHLYRSRLSPKGARYEVMDTFVLGGDILE
jgi:2'-5' RNA ligase